MVRQTGLSVPPPRNRRGERQKLVKMLFSKVLWLARGTSTALALAVLPATVLAATLPAVALAAGNDLWTRQFGTTEQDIAYGAAVYGTEVYAAGITWGAFPGKVNQGQDDIFVRKYDSDGAALWNRQLGSPGNDETRAVAVNQSGVYVAGYTADTLPGKTSKGSTDAFILRYNHSGDLLWSRQFGTAKVDSAFGIGTDSTGVYVAGSTHGTLPGEISAGFSDVFTRKYSFQGDVIWTDQFGSPSSDVSYALDADYTAGVYVVGVTNGSLPNKMSQGGMDAFVRKYDSDGAATWTRQFGSSDDDTASGIAADSSGVYVAGGTRGALPNQNAGNYDAFVRKYGLDGTTGWTKQFGTTGYDFADGVALDAPRGLQTDPPLVYVVGGTSGTLPGESSQGSSDAYARAYKKDGSIYWTDQFGTSAPDGAKAVAGVGSVAYVAGRTDGTFTGQMSKGYTDAFLRKYD
jgi:hypothetical protein